MMRRVVVLRPGVRYRTRAVTRCAPRFWRRGSILSLYFVRPRLVRTVFTHRPSTVKATFWMPGPVTHTSNGPRTGAVGPVSCAAPDGEPAGDGEPPRAAMGRVKGPGP